MVVAEDGVGFKLSDLQVSLRVLIQGDRDQVIGGGPPLEVKQSEFQKEYAPQCFVRA